MLGEAATSGRSASVLAEEIQLISGNNLEDRSKSPEMIFSIKHTRKELNNNISPKNIFFDTQEEESIEEGKW